MCEQLVIVFILLYQGTAIPAELTQPFADMRPVAQMSGKTDFLGLPAVAGFSSADFASQHGKTWLRFPAGMERYDIVSLRKVYNLFQSLPPHLAMYSSMITEGYSTHGVQKVAAESTAYPDRKNSLLLSPFIVYEPDPTVNDEAGRLGKLMQTTLAEGPNRELCAYVNYAYGDEGEEAWYGREQWRLERLRRLKKIWDPNNRFGWYCPIGHDGRK